MTGLRVLPCGDTGLLVEVADAAAVLPLAAELRDDPAVIEVVPAAQTVLVRAAMTEHGRLREHIAAMADELATSDPGRATRYGSAPAVELAVTYDGADVSATAAELGLDSDTLVRMHVTAQYVVAFCGFAPGFAYLRGLDPRLHVPRLSAPRTRVPAGSVGIAAEFTGVYPRPSPGGWRLLGHTDAALWDTERDPPALLIPGTPVRFVAR